MSERDSLSLLGLSAGLATMMSEVLLFQTRCRCQHVLTDGRALFILLRESCRFIGFGKEKRQS